MTLAKNQDSQNIVIIMWIGTIFLGFIPGLIFYLIKKDDRYIVTESKEAMNWSITALIGYAIGWALALVLVGFIIIKIISICHVIFCIMGILAASKGKHYKAPFALRLIK